MNIDDYMKLSYNHIIKSITDESGTYFHGTILEFDGCQSTGETFEETYTNLKEAMEGWVEAKLSNGFSVPLPLKRKLQRQIYSASAKIPASETCDRSRKGRGIAESVRLVQVKQLIHIFL